MAIASEFRDLNSSSSSEEDNNSSSSLYPISLRIWASIGCVGVFVVGVAGNCLVGALVWRHPELRHSTNIFLLNLAIADLLVLIVCLPTALVELHTTPDTWVMGPIMCRLVPFLEVSVCRASVFTLTVISVERYIAICRPLQSSSLCTRCRAISACLIIWPIAFIAAGPMLWATEYQEVSSYHKTSQASSCITPVEDEWTTAFFMVSIGAFFAAPLILLATIYSCIAMKLLGSPRSERGKGANEQWKARKQVSVMLGAVVFVFFVCLLPFQIFQILCIFSPETLQIATKPQIYQRLLYVCRILIYVNSAINPIIYNAMSAKFRAAMMIFFGKNIEYKRGLLRKRSTMTTLSSSISSSYRSNSLRRRASLAYERRFSGASSSRRSSDRSIFSFKLRRLSSSSSRKGSCGSYVGRKSSTSSSSRKVVSSDQDEKDVEDRERDPLHDAMEDQKKECSYFSGDEDSTRGDNDKFDSPLSSDETKNESLFFGDTSNGKLKVNSHQFSSLKKVSFRECDEERGRLEK